MNACSASKRASRKLEKARRLTERAAILDPESIKADTVYKLIEIPVPSVRTDTQFVDRGIPVVIEKDRLLIKYQRDTITNEVIIQGECRADTFIRKVPVYVNKTAYIKQSFWRTGVGIFLIVAIISACLFAIIKVMKNVMNF